MINHQVLVCEWCGKPIESGVGEARSVNSMTVHAWPCYEDWKDSQSSTNYKEE